MPSPFSPMNPYLEHPDFWQETHYWLIVAIADSIMPQIRPKFEIAIKKRIYQINDINDNNDDSLLVGIFNVAIKCQPNTPDIPTSSVAIATLTVPTTVKVPAPEKIKQTYLEVREMAAKQVVTAWRTHLNFMLTESGILENNFLLPRKQLIRVCYYETQT
jgi:Protein of unknown function (DUF4058)